MMVSAHRIATWSLSVLFGMLMGMPLFTGVARAGTNQNHLYPDMFPFVDEGGLTSLENWVISGNTLQLRTVFANQGDGLFEIRRGASVNSDQDRLLQRVYINNDFGSEFEDIDIGTTPRPTAVGGPNLDDGAPGGTQAPFSSDFAGTDRLTWFEDFTRFSLLEAIPTGGGGYTVGAEVVGNTKAAFALQATSTLPGTTGLPITSPNNFFQNRISTGFGDLYTAVQGDLGNDIDITGVNRNSLYWLRQTVDPENRIRETDETNNSFEVLIDLSVNNSNALRNGDGSFVQPVPIPEPGTLVYLACLGGSSLALSRRRLRKR